MISNRGPARQGGGLAWGAAVGVLLGAWLVAAPPGASEASAAEGAQSTTENLDGSRELSRLLGDFAGMPGLTARFREEKRLALLREPLVSHGRLYFVPPDRLARYIDEPTPSALFVEAGRLSYETPDGRGAMDLQAQPTLRAFVDSFRMLLRGDMAGLRDIYRVTLAPRAERTEECWTVHLEPLDEVLARRVRSIRIDGCQRALSQVRILERGGDETTMIFSAVDSNYHFSAADLAEHFSSTSP